MRTIPTEFDIDESLALARHEIEAKQFADALSRLKTLTQGEDVSPQAILLLARLHGQLGLPAKAQAGFERFLAQQPAAVHERFELGVSQLEQGKAEGALATWDQVLQATEHRHPPAQYFSAVAQTQLKQYSQAQQSLKSLIDSTSADNMYHERGVELAKRLNAQVVQLPGTSYSSTH